MKQEIWQKVYVPQEQALSRRVQSTKNGLEEKRRGHVTPRTLAVLAAAAVVLISSVALAAGIIRSHRYDAKRLAQQALSDTYGLTREMDAFFAWETTENGDETVVTLTPVDGYMDRLGVYTVTIRGGEATARWSNDGKAADGAWDAQQLSAGIERRAAGEAWNEILAPEEDDGEMTDERAVAIARDAVARKYGPEAMPEDVTPQVESFYMADEGRTRYMVHFCTGDQSAETNWYRVDVWADDASVSSCTCLLPENMRTLPAGDLSAYALAVREYVDSGALAALPEAERYAAAERIRAAGLGDMLTADYADPASVPVTREAALTAGLDALEARYGLDANVRTLFAQDAALVTQDGVTVWTLTLAPSIDPMEDGVLLDGKDGELAFATHSERMGTYEATVDTGSGQVLRTGWTLDGANRQETVRDTWGALEVYDAQALEYLKELLAQRAAVYAGYNEETVWNLSPEDSAALDGLMRANGFSAAHYNSVLPEVGELTKEQAVERAKEALIADAGMTEDVLNGAQDRMLRCYREDGRTLWNVTFYLGGEKPGVYYVEINAASGAIEDVIVDAGLAGNG